MELRYPIIFENIQGANEIKEKDYVHYLKNKHS
jgi:hypothetical protein